MQSYIEVAERQYAKPKTATRLSYVNNYKSTKAGELNGKINQSKDRLLLPISNKSPDFTPQGCLEAYLLWGLENFHDATTWLSGPLTIYNVAFEKIFERKIKQTIERKNAAEIDTDENDFQEEYEYAARKGRESEKEIGHRVCKLLASKQKFDRRFKNVMIRRGKYDVQPTPPASILKPEVEPGHDPDRRLTPTEAKQITQKIPLKAFLDQASYEAERQEIRKSNALFDILPWDYLTHIDFEPCQRWTKKVEMLLEQDLFKEKFNAIAESLAKSRLYNQYNALNLDAIKTLFAALQEQRKKMGLPTLEANPHAEDFKDVAIKHLIEIDFNGLRSDSLAATTKLLLDELRLFLWECEKAGDYHKKSDGGATYFAYPTSPYSLGKGVFTFVAEAMEIVFGDYSAYFKWVDSSDLTPKPAQKHEAEEKAKPQVVEQPKVKHTEVEKPQVVEQPKVKHTEVEKPLSATPDDDIDLPIFTNLRDFGKAVSTAAMLFTSLFVEGTLPTFDSDTDPHDEIDSSSLSSSSSSSSSSSAVNTEATVSSISKPAINQSPSIQIQAPSPLRPSAATGQTLFSQQRPISSSAKSATPSIPTRRNKASQESAKSAFFQPAARRTPLAIVNKQQEAENECTPYSLLPAFTLSPSANPAGSKS